MEEEPMVYIYIYRLLIKRQRGSEVEVYTCVSVYDNRTHGIIRGIL